MHCAFLEKTRAIFSGILCCQKFVCSGCCKGTLFLINCGVLGKILLDKKNDETQDGVEVSALPLFIFL